MVRIPASRDGAPFEDKNAPHKKPAPPRSPVEESAHRAADDILSKTGGNSPASEARPREGAPILKTSFEEDEVATVDDVARKTLHNEAEQVDITLRPAIEGREQVRQGKFTIEEVLSRCAETIRQKCTKGNTNTRETKEAWAKVDAELSQFPNAWTTENAQDLAKKLRNTVGIDWLTKPSDPDESRSDFWVDVAIDQASIATHFDRAEAVKLRVFFIRSGYRDHATEMITEIKQDRAKLDEAIKLLNEATQQNPDLRSSLENWKESVDFASPDEIEPLLNYLQAAASEKFSDEMTPHLRSRIEANVAVQQQLRREVTKGVEELPGGWFYPVPEKPAPEKVKELHAKNKNVFALVNKAVESLFPENPNLIPTDNLKPYLHHKCIKDTQMFAAVMNGLATIRSKNDLTESERAQLLRFIFPHQRSKPKKKEVKQAVETLQAIGMVLNDRVDQTSEQIVREMVATGKIHGNPIGPESLHSHMQEVVLHYLGFESDSSVIQKLSKISPDIFRGLFLYRCSIQEWLAQHKDSFSHRSQLRFAKTLPNHIKAVLLSVLDKGGLHNLRYAKSTVERDPHLSACAERLGPTRWKTFTESIQESYSGKRDIGIITGDRNDQLRAFLFLGTDTVSCQKLDGKFEDTQALLGYVQHGKNQLLAIWDRESGALYGRAIMRLLLNTDGEPVLHLEAPYGNIKPKDRIALLEVAQRRADHLGCEIVLSKEFLDPKSTEKWTFEEATGHLKSRSCWDREYVDGGRIGGMGVHRGPRGYTIDANASMRLHRKK